LNLLGEEGEATEEEEDEEEEEAAIAAVKIQIPSASIVMVLGIGHETVQRSETKGNAIVAEN